VDTDRLNIIAKADPTVTDGTLQNIRHRHAKVAD
jgi:hypothetical protein